MSQVVEETRRTSRSNRSSSPNIEEDQDTSSTESNVQSSTVANHNRVTRSQSVESNGYEESRKRKRKQASTNEENERETRTSRNTKEARDTKKAKKDIIIKERLDELDKLEQAVKNGTHPEYHELLKNIELKKSNMIQEAEKRRSFAEKNVMNFFHAQKYAADSQYYWSKLAIRRSMIHHVQHKINLLEQEYYSNHVSSSLDEDHLTDWVPPDRPSVISSLTLGLPEEDADNDIECAKADPTNEQDDVHINNTTNNNQYPAKASPPLDMLASLVDHKKHDKDFSLPPLKHR